MKNDNLHAHFLSVRELAERWRTTPHAVHVMRWRGSAPAAVKLGARVLFPLTAVQAYEAERGSANTAADNVARREGQP